MRMIRPWNDGWQFAPVATLETLAEAEKQPVTLPHTWSSNDNARKGTRWYVREFERPAAAPGDRIWLQCDGAAMTAEVYLNGEKLARHEGGYSAFRVDLTDHLTANNQLAISVNNGANQTVYPQNADFTFYGGLYRGVKLIVVPASHFALGYRGAPGIRVTPVVDLQAKTAAVTAEAWVEGENTDSQTVTFTIAEKTLTAPVENGHAVAEVTIENVHLWDGLNDPYLYTATATLASGDEVSARFGCRRFAIDPQKGFLLNGCSYPLRGVSRHQDFWGVGSALTPEHHKKDMEIIRELGANTLRLAHYQHAQEFYDLCDENGLIVWAEIPYITRHMPEGRANTLSQIEELIAQNYNHPCIAVWGISNEVSAASAVNEDVQENHRLLNEICHRLDPTRPTTMASINTLDIHSLLLEIPDVNSYNLYFGWYQGETAQTGAFLDNYHNSFPDRVIGLSEYGADANPQYQSDAPERGDYTESYQALYHEQMLQIIEARPWLWATHVWNLFDFGADGRDEGGKHAQNQKGLVTFDRGIKKDAFYLYKAAWNKVEPFVHLCGGRYVNRTEEVTEIKVYSNQPEVTLYMDGRLVGSQTGKYVFTFQVPIKGRHSIEARARDCCAVMWVEKAEEPDAAYTMPGRKKKVVNWFDAGENDPTCFSVNDTMGDLQKDPKAGAIIGQMMAKGAASHGDVATTVADNPALIKMMGRTKLIDLMQQANVAKEQVEQINRILQGIKKPQ